MADVRWNCFTGTQLWSLRHWHIYKICLFSCKQDNEEVALGYILGELNQPYNPTLQTSDGCVVGVSIIDVVVITTKINKY